MRSRANWLNAATSVLDSQFLSHARALMVLNNWSHISLRTPRSHQFNDPLSWKRVDWRAGLRGNWGWRSERGLFCERGGAAQTSTSAALNMGFVAVVEVETSARHSLQIGLRPSKFKRRSGIVDSPKQTLSIVFVVQRAS